MRYKIRAKVLFKVKLNIQNIKVKTISCVIVKAATLTENKEEYDVNALTDVFVRIWCEWELEGMKVWKCLWCV